MEGKQAFEKRGAQKKKLQDLIAKSKRATKSVDIILKKSNNDRQLLTSVKESEQFVKNCCTQDGQKYLQQSIQLQKATCRKDSHQREELYKINSLTINQLKENFAILLFVDTMNKENENVVLHSKDEIMEILQQKMLSIFTFHQLMLVKESFASD